MKNLLIVAGLAGVAAAVYLLSTFEDETAEDEISDAASNAYDKMNEAIGSVERNTKNVFNSMG